MLGNLSLDLSSAKELLPVRDPFSHKGSFGKILLICGSRNMVGCCVLAAQGALRSGPGLVTLAFPDCLYNSLTSRLTENLFLPLVTDSQGMISSDNMHLLISEANKSDAVVIGCGIGVNGNTRTIVKTLLRRCKVPLIIDADGLNCISDYPKALLIAKCPVLLTPHPGEMARLCGVSVGEIESDRKGWITSFCKKYNVNVLLKGHETLICNSSADTVYINKTGNTGLAKGGSGDLLSGIIAGLTPSMNSGVFGAAILGAFIHGLSADILKDELSEYSILPGDCAKALPRAFKRIIDFED